MYIENHEIKCLFENAINQQIYITQVFSISYAILD